LLTQLLGTLTCFLSHRTQSPASAVLTVGFDNVANFKIQRYPLLAWTCRLSSFSDNFIYKSVLFQFKMRMAVKIFLKKKLFVEFVWLNLEKVLILLNWSVAAKVSFHWHTKNVHSNGSPLKVIEHVMSASKKFRIYLSLFYEFKTVRPITYWGQRLLITGKVKLDSCA